MTTLTVTGTDALLRRLKAIGNGRPVLQQIQLRAIREAKLKVPRKTGNLGRSIHPGSLTPNFAIVEATANYAAYVELGTRPHVIRPRTKSILAWPATPAGRRLSGRARTATRAGANGGMAFARLVHHPGTKPQPYLLPGAVEAVRQLGVQPIIDAWNDAA